VQGEVDVVGYLEGMFNRTLRLVARVRMKMFRIFPSTNPPPTQTKTFTSSREIPKAAAGPVLPKSLKQAARGRVANKTTNLSRSLKRPL
jgi:hypothetical protein